MNLSEIAASHWTKGEAAEALAALVTAWLDRQPDGKTFGTGEVMRALGATTGMLTRLSSHISNARKDGLCEGYFTAGKLGPFGRPRINWHAPKAKPALTTAQRLDAIKRDDPELYASLYASKDTDNTEEF